MIRVKMGKTSALSSVIWVDDATGEERLIRYVHGIHVNITTDDPHVAYVTLDVYQDLHLEVEDNEVHWREVQYRTIDPLAVMPLLKDKS